jgi:hypothetical protein
MKEKEIYKMNYLHGLNWLSFWKQRNDVEIAKQNSKNGGFNI